MLKFAFYLILMLLIVDGNPYSQANSKCYIFNIIPTFLFIYRLHWLHWVIEHPYLSFTTPSPSTCVSKGGGRISDGCANDAEKEVSGDLVQLLLRVDGCTFWWLLTLLSTFPLYPVVWIGIYTILVKALHGRKRRQVLEEVIKILTKNVHSSLGPITKLLCRFLSVCTNPLTRGSVTSCLYPQSTSFGGLSTSLILHLFFAISFTYLQWSSVEYFTSQFLILLNSGALPSKIQQTQH